MAEFAGGLDIAAFVASVALGPGGGRAYPRPGDMLAYKPLNAGAATMDHFDHEPHDHDDDQGEQDAPSPIASGGPSDPMARMFETEVGRQAASLIGNEGATLAIIQTFATELSVEGCADGYFAGAEREGHRVLVVPALNGQAPTALILAAAIDLPAPLRITDTLDTVRPKFASRALELLEQEAATPSGSVARLIIDRGQSALYDVLWIARPEIIIAKRPTMVPLACPSPALEVLASGQRSSVGMFCRDDSGDAGLTACFHGTGPVGTLVTVGGLPSAVRHADPVQDLVFVPLPDGYLIPRFAKGLAGIRADRAPGQGDPAAFEGCTSGPRTTVVSSYSPGLLRQRPTLQQRIQTPADVDRGDSGSALIDEHDRVMAFAFERTAYGEPIQFADWIWAANAFAALGLKPL